MKVRAGYTLLEVILAIAIGSLLMAALYVALDVQLRYMESGRNAVAEGQLARGLLARMAADIRLSLAVLPHEDASGSSSSGSSQPSQTSSPVGDTQYNQGLFGDSEEMTLFLSIVPHYSSETADTQMGLSDARQVTYYLVPDEGLARWEVPVAVAGETTAPAQPYILAPEVVELQFRYLDYQGSWTESWLGETTGPPRAVEITLGLLPPGESSSSQGSKPPTFYRIVVAIPSANIPQEMADGQGGASP